MDSPSFSAWVDDNEVIIDAFSSTQKLYSLPTVTGAGLENLGNTCFLNSVLQCFIHTVPLVQRILSDGHLLHSNCKKEGFCLLRALRDVILCSLASTNHAIAPTHLSDNLTYISSTFRTHRQEDAHEFLHCFLDRLESCHSQGVIMPSENVNIVKQVFGARLVSKVKCCNCYHSSYAYEPAIDLSLGIENADTLVAALRSFTKVEKIEGLEANFTCEVCEEQVSFEKKLSFDELPSVAVFHLKRFESYGGTVRKIYKHVAFPLDLDLLPFTDNSKKNDVDLKYVLYAVVVHAAFTATSGHYYCFIRLSPKVWCKFDDSKVVAVSEDFVLSQEAYVVFYAKETTPWFTSFTKGIGDSTIISDTPPISVLDNNRETVSVLENKHTLVSSKKAASNDIGSGQRVSTLVSSKRASHDIKDRPRPGIYTRKHPPQPNAIIIPGDHLRMMAYHMSCKRRLDKDIDDEACSLVKKTVPGSRGNQVMAAIKARTGVAPTLKPKPKPQPSPVQDTKEAPTRTQSATKNHFYNIPPSRFYG